MPRQKLWISTKLFVYGIYCSFFLNFIKWVQKSTCGERIVYVARAVHNSGFDLFVVFPFFDSFFFLSLARQQQHFLMAHIDVCRSYECILCLSHVHIKRLENIIFGLLICRGHRCLPTVISQLTHSDHNGSGIFSPIECLFACNFSLAHAYGRYKSTYRYNVFDIQ